MRISSVGVTMVLLGAASIARAQPGEPEPPPVPPGEGQPPPPPMPPSQAPPVMVQPPPPPPPQRNSTVDRGVIEDANSGRSWLSPTALSDPKGTWSFSDYELFFISVGYAITDELSVSATTLIPIVNDEPYWGLVSAKYQFLKAGSVRLAAQAAFTFVKDNSGTSGDGFTAGDVGGAATICMDSGCHSHIDGFLGAGFADSSQTSVPFILSGSFVARIAKHVKIVVEADSAFIAGKINSTADGALLWYGLRFTSRLIGVDLGLVKPIYSGSSNDGLVAGFPFVSFTYRGIDD